MPELILLVDTDHTARDQTRTLLREVGYLVVAVSSFATAKELLHSVNPDLLIAAIRLDAFNGLHLAARSRIDHPNLPVIITHDSPDPVLENEAKRQNAAFIVNPLGNAEFLRCVPAALSSHRRRQPVVRQWPRKQVSGVVEGQLAGAEARVFDMSYGGLRLAFVDERELPAVFDVTFPRAGLTVKARPIWASRSPTTDEFWCGAQLVDIGTPAMTDWRHFVDAAH